MYATTTGGSNLAVGYQSLYSNVGKRRNTVVGIQAMYYAHNTTENVDAFNTAIGYKALYGSGTPALNTGTSNTAVGDEAMLNNTSGSGNTALGKNALDANTTGTNNTVMGYTADVSSGGLNNSTAIGYNAIVSSSNQVRLGNTGVTSFYCNGAYTGIVSTTNRDLFADVDGKIGYVSSSLRYKDKIADMENIDWIYRLRPVNFTYKSDANHVKQYGLIAEEVEMINAGLVSYNEEGLPETVSYSTLITPLLKAVQEQQAEIEKLRKEIEEMKVNR
jgi:hypothetical protein